MNTSRMSFLIIACVMVLASGAVYYRYAKHQSLVPPKTVVVEKVDEVSSTSTLSAAEDVDISDWKTFRNEDIGLEMKIPSAWEGGAWGGSPRVLVLDDQDSFLYPRLATGKWNEKDKNVEMNLVGKKFTGTLEAFDEALSYQVPMTGESFSINDISFLRKAVPIHRDMNAHPDVGTYRVEDVVLMKKDDIVYHMRFYASVFSQEEAEETRRTWESVLKHIRLFSLSTAAREFVDEPQGPPSAREGAAPSINTASECRRITAVDTGPISEIKYSSMDRVDLYPISKAYQHLKTSEIGGGYGEMTSDIAARAFTADDCDQIQVERFFGQRVTGRLPFGFSFTVASGSKAFQEFLKDPAYTCSIEEKGDVRCLMGDMATIADLLRLKPFAALMSHIVEF